MQIVEVKTHIIDLGISVRIGSMPTFRNTGLYIQIITDEGIDGWGLVHWSPSIMSPKHFVDDFLEKMLLKKDPFMADAIYNDIYHITNRIMYGIPQVTSAIQVALWDIIGKATKQPIYKLLGGRKKKVKAYASLSRPIKPKGAVSIVKQYIDEWGYKAVKLRIGQGIKKDEKLIKAVREAFPKLEIMADVNSGYTSLIDAIKIAKICDKYELTWLEEPLPSDNLKGLAKLREVSQVPIAGGENDMGIFRFEDIISNGSYDIVQPDVTRSGGFMELKKIDAMAEVKGILCIPHVFGYGHIIAPNIHFIMASRCEFCEFPVYPEDFQMLKEPIRVENGMVHALEKPGLGVEISEKMFETYKIA
ncbi:MAG: mandelate racemase/muconate lactonizing enzyme family protein [archaeon]|nr:mandelate racemase/muconate lactonizing enzyme family protein [archaeon]